MSDFLVRDIPLFAATSGEAHGTTFLGLGFYTILSIIIIVGAMFYAKPDLKNRVFKNPVTQWFEQLFLFIENMAVGIIGPHGRKYIPMMMILWLMIFVGNVVALFFPSATTADMSFNLGMALIAVGYVQYEGIRTNGLFGHLSHFSGPKMTGGLVVISGMIFIIEIISEVMKNVSLTLRLYGNIDGGHRAVEEMNRLGASVLVPIGAFLLPIKVLTCVVQALIFTLLTCVYLSLVTHHSDHHEEHHEEEEVPTPSQTEGQLAFTN